MAPHSSTFAWRIPWTEEPGRLQSIGSLESDMTERLHFHFSLSCTGEGNGNLLQCSCLENPKDREAWWAAVYGVAQSWTRLKRLSSSSGKEPACQCRKCSRSRFNSWIGKIFWRKKWQPTPLFLPGESQGWQSLAGCCLWGRTESDTTEGT